MSEVKTYTKDTPIDELRAKFEEIKGKPAAESSRPAYLARVINAELKKQVEEVEKVLPSKDETVQKETEAAKAEEVKAPKEAAPKVAKVDTPKEFSFNGQSFPLQQGRLFAVIVNKEKVRYFSKESIRIAAKDPAYDAFELPEGSLITLEVEKGSNCKNCG